MPHIIMCRGLIDLSTRTPLSIARLSASASSSHDLSLAAFTINIAESNFRHTHLTRSERHYKHVLYFVTGVLVFHAWPGINLRLLLRPAPTQSSALNDS